MQDPFGQAGFTIAGPGILLLAIDSSGIADRSIGFRVPFYIISPWTRGGNVFTEHADHTSQSEFLFSSAHSLITNSK